MKANISFYRKNNGYVYCQIYFGGTKSIFSTGIKVKVSDWNEAEKIPKSKTKIEALQTLTDNIKKAEEVLSGKGGNLTANALKNEYIAIFKKPKEKPILEILAEFIEFKNLKGEIKNPNYRGYKAKIEKIKAFLKAEKLENLSYSDFTYSIYEKMLIALKNSKQTGDLKNTYLRTILGTIRQGNKYALKKGYTKALLFDFDSLKEDTKETAYLTLTELEKIENLVIEDTETEFIRDIFLFCSYTGFLHSDLKDFEPQKHIVQDSEGDLWIIKPRTKTGELISQLIHPKAKMIFDKWESLTPYYDMKHNRTLKVLAKMCNIRKEVSVRVARRTFAMLHRNEYQTPDEVTHKIMGHKNTKVLQKHYVKSTDKSIKNALKSVYNGIEETKKATETSKTKEDLMLEVLTKVSEKLDKIV